jgi:hypothetical protein
MNFWRILDLIFPYIEKLTAAQQIEEEQRLEKDVAAIEATDWTRNDERALDEAQKVNATENDRVRTAEGKATTYLAVLAALVPLIITLQAANWEKKAGPAPDAARLIVLAVATVYVAAAGYHAFKTLQVSGFQRVGEAEIAAAWKTQRPIRKLARGTLLATRRSRDAVNAKITRIRVTHEHLLRAFGTFVLLLLLDPLFYAMGFRNTVPPQPVPKVTVVARVLPSVPQASPVPIGRPQVGPPANQQPAIQPPTKALVVIPPAERTADCAKDAQECAEAK